MLEINVSFQKTETNLLRNLNVFLFVENLLNKYLDCRFKLIPDNYDKYTQSDSIHFYSRNRIIPPGFYMGGRFFIPSGSIQ